MTTRESPLGVAWQFPIAPNALGRIGTTDDLGSGSTSEEGEKNLIFQAIEQIVGTNEFERIFNPEFYGGIREYLFEPLSDFLDGVAETVFFDNVSRIEPRITIINTFTKRDHSTAKLRFGIRFLINDTGVEDAGII